MSTVTLQEAQARLPEIITSLLPGEDIQIIDHDIPVAKLIVERAVPRKPRKAGSARGKITIISEDDDHLKDFAEYMP
jgi:antitoxin (DNA-binding transcriptional repressor) of toxin-antitoxin stability system